MNRLAEVAAPNLATVDVDSSVIDEPLGFSINTADFIIHSAIHAERPELACVCAAHAYGGWVTVSRQRDGRNHGLLTYGGRAAEPFNLTHNMEYFCRAQLVIPSVDASYFTGPGRAK